MKRLDLIIDALECAVSDETFELNKYEKALAAARELRELKPVAWKDKTYGNLHHQNWGDNTPLYALGDEK